MTFRVDKKTMDAQIDMKIRPSGRNVREQLRACRFQALLAKGAELTFIFAESRLPAFRANPPASAEMTVPPGQLELLDALLQIQERCSVPLSAPDRNITAEEVEFIHRTAEDVTRGMRTFPWDFVRLQLNREQATGLLEALSKTPFRPVRTTSTDHRDLFGAKIDLSPVEFILPSTKILEEDERKLRAELEDESRSQFDLKVSRAEKVDAVCRWPRFAPPEKPPA